SMTPFPQAQAQPGRSPRTSRRCSMKHTAGWRTATVGSRRAASVASATHSTIGTTRCSDARTLFDCSIRRAPTRRPRRPRSPAKGDDVRGSVTEIYRLFDGQSRTLHIPVYQRNYDWSAKQCSRLFDDLEAIILKDRPKHFFGAVVGNPVSSFEWVVIDGQQRLTTVSLLILALSRSAES